MTFADVLKRLREEAGLTQAALAERAGLSIRTVQSWEQGRRSPVSPDFFKLVRGLGQSADAFAEITDDDQAEAPKEKKAAPKKTGGKPARGRGKGD